MIVMISLVMIMVFEVFILAVVLMVFLQILAGVFKLEEFIDWFLNQ